MAAIAAIGTIASSLMSVVSATGLLGGKGVNMTPINQFQIPQQTMDQLNQQINQNSALGTQANAAAQQAIQQYSTGQLSAAYQGQYDQQYQQQMQAIQAQLAAQGFDKNSTQYQAALEQFNTSMASTKSQMLQAQLNAALSEAGIDQSAIANINSILSTESGINAQNNQAILDMDKLQLEQKYLKNQDLAQMGKALGGLSGDKFTGAISKLFPSGNSSPSKVGDYED